MPSEVSDVGHHLRADSAAAYGVEHTFVLSFSIGSGTDHSSRCVGVEGIVSNFTHTHDGYMKTIALKVMQF